VVLIDSETGALADPVLTDRVSGKPMTGPPFRSAPGPAADARTRVRHQPAPPAPAARRRRAAPAGGSHV
jgi:hypothetical protein